MKPQIVVELPEEQEIESVEETRLPASPGIIQKTIRYKNGMIATLLKDFNEAVFSVQLRAADPFCISRNQLLRVT